MTSKPTIPLSDLLPGEQGRIEHLASDTPEHLRNRVFALGFVPGTIVKTVRKAPLGDPTEYELRGGRVSLRRSEARLVAIVK